MKKRTNKVAVFTLPNEVSMLNDLLEDDMITVTEKSITPCPKEGIILYLVEYEDYN